MDVTIREANENDAIQLIENLINLSKENDIDLPLKEGEFKITEEQEREILNNYKKSENSVFLVAEINNQIVGCLDLTGGKRNANKHVVTLGMSIVREYRNQGIGDLLIKEAISWAKNNPLIKRIELFVYERNKRGIHLYLKNGFKIEGQREKYIFQDGQYLDDIIMGMIL